MNTDNSELKEKRRAPRIVAFTFTPLLILCVIKGIYLAATLTGLDMNQPAPGYFLPLLIGAAMVSSVFSWLLWLLLGRLIFGGEKLYRILQLSTFGPVFKPESKFSKFFTPWSLMLDKVLRRLLGIKPK